MNDSQTTIGQLRQVVADFVAQRDWSQFHSPKNLSMSIAIEAAELMEHFQWISQEASKCLDADQQQGVRDELADVVCYCLALANSMDFDLSNAVEKKMLHNRQKYPAEDFKGLYGRDDPGFSPNK